jgi:hypothetical protein
VPWRFLDAGRHSAWKGSSCRRPKTCTRADVRGRRRRHLIRFDWPKHAIAELVCLESDPHRPLFTRRLPRPEITPKSVAGENAQAAQQRSSADACRASGVTSVSGVETEPQPAARGQPPISLAWPPSATRPNCCPGRHRSSRQQRHSPAEKKAQSRAFCQSCSRPRSPPQSASDRDGQPLPR